MRVTLSTGMCRRLRLDAFAGRSVEAGKKFLAVLMLHYIHLCVQRCLGPTSFPLAG